MCDWNWVWGRKLIFKEWNQTGLIIRRYGIMMLNLWSFLRTHTCYVLHNSIIKKKIIIIIFWDLSPIKPKNFTLLYLQINKKYKINIFRISSNYYHDICWPIISVKYLGYHIIYGLLGWLNFLKIALAQL